MFLYFFVKCLNVIYVLIYIKMVQYTTIIFHLKNFYCKKCQNNIPTIKCIIFIYFNKKKGSRN